MELWVYTLLADFRKYEGLLKDKDRAYEALIEKGRQDEKQHKYQVGQRLTFRDLLLDSSAGVHGLCGL